MDVRETMVKQAISHFRYGVSHDIFCEPVATYAKLAIGALEKENGATVREWISVDDRFPELGEEAICISADGDMMIGKYTEWGWLFPCYFEEITYWMPVPKPPQEDDNGEEK